MTGTEAGKAERSEVYKVGLVTNSFGREVYSLTFLSGYEDFVVGRGVNQA